MNTSSELERLREATSTQWIERASDGVRQTQQLGEALGALLIPGDIILLYGDLGAGKTAFTQGIGRGLGVVGVVNSPTFTILKEYSGRIPLYHFDLYRIEDADEALSLGFEDYFNDDGACVVEWAERGGDSHENAIWPNDWLSVHIRIVSPDQRVLRCAAAGARGRALLEDFAATTANEGRLG